MKSIGIFSWFYDVVPDEESIKFFRFKFFKTNEVYYPDISMVIEVGKWKRAPIASLDWQNRIFSRTFLIKTNQGILWRNILITPEDPENFCLILQKRNIPLKKS